MMNWVLQRVRVGLVVILAGGWSLAGEIKIVSLNIEWFPGQKTRPSPDEIQRHMADTRETLAELAPDILIATEICEEAAFRDVLQAVPGLELHVISNFKFSEDEDASRRNQQIAIAARLPALAAWAEPWQTTMDQLRRGFSFVALENPESGKLILVYGVHLKSNRSNSPEEEQMNYDLRDESIRQLLSHMEKMEVQFAERGIDAWIIGGDFNTNDDGRFGDNVVKMLMDAGFWNSWSNTAGEDRFTWKERGQFSSTTFDYVFTKGLGEQNAQLFVTGDNVSDHNAVVLYVDLPAVVELETTDSIDETALELEPEPAPVTEPEGLGIESETVPADM